MACGVPTYGAPDLVLFNFNQDLIAVEHHFMDRSGSRGRHTKRFSSSHIESSSMPRAFNRKIVQFAIAERTAVMCANVIDTVKIIAIANQDDQPIGDFQQSHFTMREIIPATD
jgi:hypothetical protein